MRSGLCPADDQDSVVNVADPGVDEEPANPTLARFQGSWLTLGGGMGLVEGTEVLWNSGETASLVSPEPNIVIFFEGDECNTGTLLEKRDDLLERRRQVVPSKSRSSGRIGAGDSLDGPSYHEEWPLSTSGFGERRDLTRSEVLQHRVRNSSRCEMCYDLHKQVALSSLISKVVPVLSAHAERSECGRNKIGNFGQEKFRH